MNEPLFPEPARLLHELSQMHSTYDKRARKGRSPKWNTYRSRTAPWCDECFAEQHEHRHEELRRVRARASMRRSISGGPDLLLCGAHTYLWKKRDEEDMA